MSKEAKKPFRQSMAEWRQFVYNPNSGEFLGRTAKSWGLILLFYLVFYGFLAALFTFTMWVMLQTLSSDIPKYRDRISSPEGQFTSIGGPNAMSVSAFFILQHKAGLQRSIIRVPVSPTGPGSLAVHCSCSSTRGQQLTEASRRPPCSGQGDPDCCSVRC